MNFNFRLILILSFFYHSVYAEEVKSLYCKSSQLALDNGRELYNRGQYLLSLQEFSVAQKFDCTSTLENAQWGYLLAITELGEKNEMFFLSHNVYPKKFNLSGQQKLKLYQSYYFPKADSTKESLRVQAFLDWKEALPQQKSPAVAGLLSAVVPGTGQAYTGSWQSGALAFVLNALFLSTTIELSNRDLHASSLASGVIFSITYFGNILNAVESTKIYNQNYNKSQIESEKAKRFPELIL